MAQQTNVTKVVRVSNSVAAGTTAATSTALDTAGFSGVRFLIALGAIVSGAVTSIKATQADDSGMSTNAEDLAGSGITVADTDDNSVCIVDIYNPKRRYLTVTVSRGTQNATIDGIIAELYAGKKYPETADTTVSHQKVLATPAAGTP